MGDIALQRHRLAAVAERHIVMDDARLERPAGATRFRAIPQAGEKWCAVQGGISPPVAGSVARAISELFATT